jgi:hypothetical protein
MFRGPRDRSPGVRAARGGAARSAAARRRPRTRSRAGPRTRARPGRRPGVSAASPRQKKGTKYAKFSEHGMKWVSGGTNRQCDNGPDNEPCAHLGHGPHQVRPAPRLRHVLQQGVNRLGRDPGLERAALVDVEGEVQQPLLRALVRPLLEHRLRDRHAVGHCPGRRPPCFTAKRPARPCESAIENRFTAENATAAQTPRAGPDGHQAATRAGSGQM